MNDAIPRNRRSDDCRRRGMAPLEFVMSMPFLLFLAAYTASLGWANLKLAGTTVEVRREVWQARANPGASQFQHKPNKPLSSILDAFSSDMGQLTGEANANFNVFWKIPGRSKQRTARSKTALLAGSWDHKEVKDFTNSPQGPHFNILAQIAGVDIPLLNDLGKLFDMKSTVENDQEHQDAKANEEAEKQKSEAKKQELQEEINKLEAQKQVKIGEKNALIGERNQLQSEKQTLLNDLQDLQNQADDFDPDPVPQSLLNQIAAKQNEINAKQVEIDAKQVEINAKQAEIDEIQRQINEFKATQDRMNDELAPLG